MNNIQQPKPDPKGKIVLGVITPRGRAIIAIVLGIITMISSSAYLFWIMSFANKPHAGPIFGIMLLIFGPLLLSGIIVGLIGTIYGIIHFKSTKRDFSSIWVVLCIIILILEFFLSLFLLPS